MKRKIKVLIVAIITIILSPYLIARIPIQHVRIDIDTINGEIEPVNYETKQLYIQQSEEYSTWIVLGKDGVLFDDNNKEHIFIVGNFPNQMNYALTINTFVVNGRYLGKKSLGKGGFTAGCFEVDNWGILGPVKRYGNKKLSESSLTIEDYISEQRIPDVTLDDLEDVE